MSRIFSILVLLIAVFCPRASESQTVTVPEVKLVNNDLFVSFSLSLQDKSLEAIRGGVDKELKFYVDLFKMWKVWPDEFVIGKKLVRVLKSDPIKREYVATNLEGNLFLEKRFKDAESMIAWAMNITDIKLVNVREFEPGTYFIKVTVESHMRKLPPVIGHLLFFVAEKEFSVSKNSDQFPVNQK